MRTSRLALVLGLLAAALCRAPAAAGIEPSTELLVPVFEVDLASDARNSYFALGNHSKAQVEARFEVLTNWGVLVMTTQKELAPQEVFTANLRDWFVFGRLPDRQLDAPTLAHVQAALSGRPSPRDGLYYGPEVAPGRAAGYIQIQLAGAHRDSFWGDYFVVDRAIQFAEGETLVNLDRGVDEHLPCASHGLRFLDSPALALSTEIMVWSPRRFMPQPTAWLAEELKVSIQVEMRDENGALLDRRELSVDPVAVFRVADLKPPAAFGWLQITAPLDVFLTAHVAASGETMALHSYCLPEEPEPFSGPSIRLEKWVNGTRPGNPPGLAVAAGSTLSWEFVVTNSGTVPLYLITLVDTGLTSIACPTDSLAPQETMTCTASSVAAACQQQNTVTVSAMSAAGDRVSDSDVAFVFGEESGVLAIEKRLNGLHVESPPGPALAAGSPIAWTYLLANRGSGALTQVLVSDDSGFAVSCPKAALAAGETMTCTAASTAQPGAHSNVATATGKPACGGVVRASDASYYTGQTPAISITKLVNGEDANDPPGAPLAVGSAVLWSYVVTNTGDVALNSVSVSDDRGVAVSCPKTRLDPGESMTCAAAGTANAGPYRNIGTATGRPPAGDPVSDSDPAHYFGYRAAIGFEKRVNGEDADVPPGPRVVVGATLSWTYVVTNSGDVRLTAIAVTDSQGFLVTCPKTTLEAAESMTCTASTLAAFGQQVNVASVVGTPTYGPLVTASDPAHYFGLKPGIAIEKLVNGEEADTPPGPTIQAGASVLWTYVVTNTGDVRLSEIGVTDNQGLTVSCPKTVLVVAESMTCTASATAVQGQYSNIGKARGRANGSDIWVEASDPCYYYGAGAGNQGCTPGYWKNHTSSWPPTGYTTGQTVLSAFSASNRFPSLASATLLQALSFGGGPGDQGAAEILLRAGVAALLNAAHPGVAYPRTVAAVVADVNTALGGTRDQMLALAAALDADNNRGCPLH